MIEIVSKTIHFPLFIFVCVCVCVKTLQLVNFHNFHLKLELWALIKTCLAMSEVIGAHESVISCSMNLCSRLSFEPNGHWLQHCTQKKKNLHL